METTQTVTRADSLPPPQKTRQEGENLPPKVAETRQKPQVEKGGEEQEALSRNTRAWARMCFDHFVLGTANANQAEDIDRIYNNFYKTALTLPGDKHGAQVLLTVTQQEQQMNDFTRKDESFARLPDSAKAFLLHRPAGGSRLISSFNDQLAQKIDVIMEKQLSEFSHDYDSSHLLAISRIVQFAQEARELYATFNHDQSPVAQQLLERLRYLGLTKNLLTEGEGSELVMALVKAAEFGRNTVEDKGKTYRSAAKNRLTTGENPNLSALHVPITDASGNVLDPMHDETLLKLVQTLTTDSNVAELRQHETDPQTQELIDWTVRQAIIREMLPKEVVVPSRAIDMGSLQKVKDLGKDESTDKNFQASNPISLWVDSETGRKFVVKQCPEQTLQSDYFGLEVLQLFGAPIYEFYYGYVPGQNGGTHQRVLVSGFLEGFTEPSHLVDLPENAPPGMANARLPERYHTSPYIQRAMLSEILIGEYNSKAHNFMILGDSVQHLDQGGSLTSTASGKFKGFSETITMQDIQDVIQCFPDWDYDAVEPVNQAYAQIAEVREGKLVIKDAVAAEKLLRQLQQVPQGKIDQALEQAGYQDGPSSIARMHSWIDDIQTRLLPQYEAKLAASPSARAQQYLRWGNEAIQTFQKAIAMGGELSYYKHALAGRRASLEKLWGEAISEAEEKKKAA